MRRAVDAALGVVVLGLVGVLVLMVVLVYNKAFTDTVQVKLETGSIGNALRVGSDVEVRGVPVGRVKKIETTGDGATLTLDIEPGQARRIPSDSEARLLPKTLFGERYVSLQSPTTQSTDGGDGTTQVAYLRSGDVLHEDTSAESVELQQVLDDLLPLLQAVQPQKLAAMLGELSATLRGNGRDLGDTATVAARYLGKLNPMVPQLSDDLAALGRVAQNYSSALPDLLSSFDNFSATSQTVVADQKSLASTISRVTDAGNAGSGFLSANQETIVVLSRQSRRALDAVRPYARTFPCVFSSLHAFIPRMDVALGAGTSQPGLQADVTVAAISGAPAIKTKSKGKASCPTNTPTKSGADGSGARDLLSASGDGSAVVGLGQTNSPQENRILAELLAPSRGIDPDQFPQWGSLLLGPILRGSSPELR